MHYSEIVESKKIIKEASRLYSAVRLDEIPEKYRHLKVLGRGTTTICLEKDADTVLLLTRDHIKSEWLTKSWGMDIAEFVDAFEVPGHPVSGISDIEIHVLQMPKLFPLDLKNKRIVRDLLKEFVEIKQKAFNYNANDSQYQHMIIQQYQSVIEKHEEQFENPHQLANLINFLSNYDVKQYNWDLGPRNFMQDAKGKLIVLDPVVSSELLTLYRKSREQKNKGNRRW